MTLSSNSQSKSESVHCSENMDAVDIKIEVVEDNDVDPSDNNNTRLNPVTELPLALVKRKERDITERQRWRWDIGILE